VLAGGARIEIFRRIDAEHERQRQHRGMIAGTVVVQRPEDPLPLRAIGGELVEEVRPVYAATQRFRSESESRQDRTDARRVLVGAVVRARHDGEVGVREFEAFGTAGDDQRQELEGLGSGTHEAAGKLGCIRLPW
jgi:hypothetical protein